MYRTATHRKQTITRHALWEDFNALMFASSQIQFHSNIDHIDLDFHLNVEIQWCRQRHCFEVKVIMHPLQILKICESYILFSFRVFIFYPARASRQRLCWHFYGHRNTFLHIVIIWAISCDARWKHASRHIFMGSTWYPKWYRFQSNDPSSSPPPPPSPLLDDLNQHMRPSISRPLLCNEAL